MLAIIGAFAAKAQQPIIPGNPVTLQNAPQRDTSNRSNSAHWRDEPVRIFKTKAFSEVKSYPDTNLHNFQRRPFVQDWYRDLGNHGTAAENQVFTPENLGSTGPSLGYHVFDIYRFKADSLQYYNTTRPYTVFNYQLGSKLEQTLHLLHTQNIKPNWNVAAQYQKIGCQGFYKLQRTNHDAGALSTHYKSPNQHYELFGALVYNKEQTDENGGILGDSLLDVAKYSDRQTIPVALDNPYYTQTSSVGRRSAITNVDRNFNILLQHQYTLGKRDTVYNKDSTQYTVVLVPRFSLRHRLEAGSEKHTFKDVAPDSVVYSPFFQYGFGTHDSVFSQQNWTWIDNQVSLNGFIGPKENQLAVSAGIGSRVDDFYTNYLVGKETNNNLSTYLVGDVGKEAIGVKSWGYDANAKFVISGSAVGDFLLKGNASKDLGKAIGRVSVGALQQLTDAPYAYTIFQNQYFVEKSALSKESTTLLFAKVSNSRFGLNAGIKNYVIGNYVFLKDSLEGVSNGRLLLSQNTGAFNLTQVSLRKVFRFGHFVSDNDFVFQQITGAAPVSVPTLLGRNALSIETYLFAHALKVATGAEVRYHTRYNATGYSPFYNRFYYQDTYTTENKPELNLFFNFKIKRFRAYLMADQVQALWWRNTVIHPNYASPDLMLRFGFDWVMVN
ncbi:MAG: putative porin [Chitinophagaceae bacterium]